MKQGPDIHIGPPAWGCDFFDRTEVIEECWEKLRSNSIILSAPRRYGKSSVMLRLRDKPPGKFFPIYFELEHHFNLSDFLYEFMAKILESDQSVMKKFKKKFSKILGKIDSVSIFPIKIKIKEAMGQSGGWEEWKEKIKMLITDLLDARKQQKVVFIFDEFPLMLYNFLGEGEKGERDAVKVLQWLRALRHNSPFLENVRFMFGGSIGLEKVASYLKATRAINDVGRVNIGPFKDEVAEDFIKKLFQAKGIDAEKSVVLKIMEIAGAMIPIYLQIMIDAVIKESMNTSREISPGLVLYCYEKRVHGPEYRRYFEDYYERLCRYYSPEESKSARRILRELANADDGIACSRLFQIYSEDMGSRFDKDKFELLLAALESDFYIERNQAKENVYFHNKWLKDWWRKQHGI